MRLTNIELQISLGIPELKRTETRQALFAVFQVYRQYKQVLKMGFEPIVRKEPLSGYKNATEPSTIRAQYKYSSQTENEALNIGDPREEQMRDFIRNVDGKVNALSDYKREIIRRRYLTDQEPLPTDDAVHAQLCNEKWYVGFRYYEKQKAEAITMLAYALGVAVYEKCADPI